MLIRYLGQIENIVGKKEEELRVNHEITVRDLLNLLSSKYGKEFERQIQTPDGCLYNDALILLNGTNIDHMGGLDTRFNDSSRAEIVVGLPAVGGG